MRSRLSRCLAGVFALTCLVARASEGPRPVALPPSVAAPRDVPFDGRIQLRVDASDTAHRIYRVRETIPVSSAGPVTLLYPRWETGSHAPTASVSALAGLVVTANGRRLAWQRDTVDAFAFHVDVPTGTRSLDVAFQFTSPLSSRQGMVTMTPDIVTVPWQSTLLYPAGWFARNIAVEASVVLPRAFDGVSALDGRRDGDTMSFAPVSLERLVDSPVEAAKHVARYDLSAPGDAAPVRLTTLSAADTPTISSDHLTRLRRMVEQTRKLLPTRHYSRYEFMLALTDALPGPGGIEQAQSSSNTLPVDFFTRHASYLVDQDLLAHEFVHSWNGRYRQPADLWTAAFNEPMRGSLLWVYEGQTEFWGRILAARAGLRTTQETLDALAVGAAAVIAQTGRAWKSLQDSTNDAAIAAHGLSWRDWQRREDYYGEGVFLWLAVDATIRERTHDTKSLDDFARDFFGDGVEGDLTTSTYTFDDVCAALDRIAPYDWRTFLRSRLDAHDPSGLLDGLNREGYRLVFDAQPSDYSRQTEDDAGARDFSTAIGLTVGNHGVVKALTWDGPAFHAGLVPGTRIDTVNGKAFAPENLAALLTSPSPSALHLGTTLDDVSHEVVVQPIGPLRYPHLRRIEGTPDRLVRLMAPLP